MGTPTAAQDPDTLAINTIRGLCMDAVQRANSGHPGTPVGLKQLLTKFRFTPDRVAAACECLAAAGGVAG